MSGHTFLNNIRLDHIKRKLALSIRIRFLGIDWFRLKIAHSIHTFSYCCYSHKRAHTIPRFVRSTAVTKQVAGILHNQCKAVTHLVILMFLTQLNKLHIIINCLNKYFSLLYKYSLGLTGLRFLEIRWKEI